VLHLRRSRADLETLGTQAVAWGILLSAFAYARALVTVRRPWLAHAQELTYPFYILHQTVILLVGWTVLSLPVGTWSLFGVVLALSFLSTWGLSELVARVRWLRPCFGLKPMAPRTPRPIPQPEAAQPAHPA
jgi:glucans biosynthesis protein C